MDGTERSIIVKTDIEWPNGMSIGKDMFFFDIRILLTKKLLNQVLS
jgi:hypothetical protein